MKVSIRKYIHIEISLLKEFRKSETEWVKIYLDSEIKSLEKATQVFTATMNEWKKADEQWKDIIEKDISKGITRREAWIIFAAIATWILTTIGLFIAFLNYIKK